MQHDNPSEAAATATTEETKEQQTLDELKELEKEFLSKANERERVILEQL